MPQKNPNSEKTEINSRGNRRGMSPESQANIKNSNGPGRPLGSKNWATLLGEAGITETDEVERIKTLYRIAKNENHKGCLIANEILNDRNFGKSTMPISNPDGSDLKIVVHYDRKARHASG